MADKCHRDVGPAEVLRCQEHRRVLSRLAGNARAASGKARWAGRRGHWNGAWNWCIDFPGTAAPEAAAGGGGDLRHDRVEREADVAWCQGRASTEVLPTFGCANESNCADGE
eukprot:gene6370-2139_t